MKNSCIQISMVVALLSLGIGCASTPSTTMTAQDETVRVAIEQRLTPKSRRDYSINVTGASLEAPELVRAFYQKRNFQPAWTKRQKANRPARDLTKSIAYSYKDGLQPERYHLSAIQAATKETAELNRAVDLELLLTDAYMIYASHLAGLLTSTPFRKMLWTRNGDQQDAVALLSEGLSSPSFSKHLAGLVTDEAGYARLKQALAQYREYAAKGGWTSVSPGPALRSGDQSPRVTELQERLKATKDLRHASHTFDGETDAAVRNFQRRHGLKIDGVVEKETLAALNIPVEVRIRQIKVNMQRRRWLPDQMGRRHVVVNIPDYELRFMDKNQPILAMNVVVGKRSKDWKTPSIMSSVTHMILNPQWNVPPGIFKKELIHKIRKDPDYLKRQNMKVLKGREIVEIDSVDWENVSGNEGIRVVQRSGRGNALGTVKFMFPNPYAIYMHDTRAKSLFKRHKRAFSHGCVRVAEPLNLAEQLMASGDWPRQKIVSEIGSGNRQTVRLPEPVNVYVQYWTAWADPNGDVQFRPDIYSRDSQVGQILGL